MKKLFIIISTLVAFSISSFAQEAATVEETQSKAKIEFDSQVKDFGTIEFAGDGSHTFKFTNTGEAPLIISNVKPTCGCTVADGWPKEAILPGESGEIKIKYDTKRTGQFTKTIKVTTNTAEPEIRLTIKGVVKPNPSTTVIGE